MKKFFNIAVYAFALIGLLATIFTVRNRANEDVPTKLTWFDEGKVFTIVSYQYHSGKELGEGWSTVECIDYSTGKMRSIWLPGVVSQPRTFKVVNGEPREIKVDKRAQIN